MEQEDLSTVITVKLRISPKLRDLIAESAKANNRSMNADMNFRLEKSFAQEQMHGNFNGQPLTINDVIYAAVANTIPNVIADIYKGLLEVGVSAETINKAAMKQIEQKPQSQTTEESKPNNK